MKKGGGGTGLLYGSSDKSSSSSTQKLNKKSNASSNSSGAKEIPVASHSEYSSSEKSDQRHFDRLMKRNDIYDLSEILSEPIESISNNDHHESKNYIKFTNL